MAVKLSVDHWEKVKRQYSKVKEIQQGTMGEDSDNFKDQISHFFQDCFHLKDWIKKDEPRLKQKVEDLFDKTNGIESFKICADFANREKHAEAVIRTRIDSNTSIKTQSVKVAIGSPVVSYYSWQIMAGGNYYDVFKLAKDCMREWQKFIQSEGLSYLK